MPRRPMVAGLRNRSGKPQTRPLTDVIDRPVRTRPAIEEIMNHPSSAVELWTSQAVAIARTKEDTRQHPRNHRLDNLGSSEDEVRDEDQGIDKHPSKRRSQRPRHTPRSNQSSNPPQQFRGKESRQKTDPRLRQSHLDSTPQPMLPVDPQSPRDEKSRGHRRDKQGLKHSPAPGRGRLIL